MMTCFRSCPWLAVLALAACHQPPGERAAERSADPARIKTLLRGSVLYHRRECRVCHSYAARGSRSKGGPSLVDDVWVHCDGSIDGIRQVIMSGIDPQQVTRRPAEQEEDEITGMPTAAEIELAPEEVDAIATYVHGLALLDSTDRSSVSEAEVLLRGSVAYHVEDCRKCHYSGAAGGASARGPSLVDDVWLHCDGSLEGIRAVIVSGVGSEQIHDKQKARGSEMPPADEMGISESEIDAIARYLHGIARLEPAAASTDDPAR